MNRSLRTHYHLRNKIFKDWYLLVHQAVKHNRPQEPLEKCTIKIERLFFRFLDFDGCVASMKPIVDGLIHSDIIKDDSYKITGPWNVFQTFRKKKDGPLIKIEVQDGTN